VSGPNRLAQETSPYLRQHADNPVDWYPWGDEAFARAKAEDKPVLLSVGYSACHWCHVMAHESFEDDDVAAVMNSLFVSIKVDREERPDVDAVYMDAVQAVAGRGGWPMTVFLTPDGRPFFGGTYFPKPNFLDLLRAVDDAWRKRRDELVQQAGQLTQALARTAELAGSGDLPGPDVITSAFDHLVGSFDRRYGGFNRAPKFPMTASLELCLRGHTTTGRSDLLEVVSVTLDAMASGGIYDHLGGGFSRYSVDDRWLVPHFEKMLYDQALLLRVFTHAGQVTGEARYRQVVEEIITYVLRDLRAPEGGFYSAEDADSEGVEGRFYVWTIDEIEAVLGAEAAAVAVEWYGATTEGNFEGANILHRPVRGELIRPDEVEAARLALFEARTARVRPGLDDKVLIDWNAMMVAALAEAAAAYGRPDWLAVATETAEFLLSELRRPDGRWLRSWQREGGARHLALAGDYAALVDAFTRLAEATGRADWIERARRAADTMLDRYWDVDRGGLFTVADDGEALVVRQKDLVDNAVPATNSTAALALLRLAALTGESRYANHADRIFSLLAPVVGDQPIAFAQLLSGLDMRLAGATEIVVAGDRVDLVRAAQERYLPRAVLAWGERYDSPLWEARDDGSAYVCEGYSCRLPATELGAFIEQLTPGANCGDVV
jgi:uncharacterized protein YyaL (SSP411 family)